MCFDPYSLTPLMCKEDRIWDWKDILYFSQLLIYDISFLNLYAGFDLSIQCLDKSYELPLFIRQVSSPFALFIDPLVKNIHVQSSDRMNSFLFWYRHSDKGREAWWWLDHQWWEDVDNKWHSSWLDVLAGQHKARATTPEQVFDLFTHGFARWDELCVLQTCAGM